MADDHDDNNDDTDREGPPPVSRLARGSTRGYRALSRPGGRYRGRDRFSRHRQQRAIAELIGSLIRHHGLTDEVRQRSVCLYWPEIVGERIASKTFPVSLIETVLHVSAMNSSWVHEMQFFRTRLVVQINEWVDANRIWLGPPPLVSDIRFTLTMPRRERLVDPKHALELRMRHLRRMRPRDLAPPIISEAERDAICRETSAIVDAELRSIIEAVRTKWNR